MRERGPAVFLDYEQAALDAAYDQASYAPNREQLIRRRIRDRELARRCIGEPREVRLCCMNVDNTHRSDPTLD